jgi:hypothetical protein
MKIIVRALLAGLALSASALASAGTLNLPTPNTVVLTPYVSVPGACSASTATTSAYNTVVTGFTADGNFVTGQVPASFVCGRSGRGGVIYHYSLCVQFKWDLSGNLVNTVATTALDANGKPVSSSCPTADPAAVYTNTGGYEAQTLTYQACVGIYCSRTYYYPTLVTP